MTSKNVSYSEDSSNLLNVRVEFDQQIIEKDILVRNSTDLNPYNDELPPEDYQVNRVTWIGDTQMVRTSISIGKAQS